MGEFDLSSPDVTVTSITADTLKNRIDAGDPVTILDTRRESEYETWHIDGPTIETINIPHTAFDGDIDPAVLDELPTDRTLTVVCAKGKSSAAVAAILDERGYDVNHLTDGMNGWARIYEAVDIDRYDGHGTVRQYQRPSSGCLGYLVYDETTAAVIDPLRAFTDRYLADAAELGVDLAYAFDTHIHADHISGVRALAADGVDGVLPKPAVDRGVTYSEQITLAQDGDQFAIGEIPLEVIHTPGHTSGMTSYLIDESLLATGDGLFIESVARPDLEAGADGARQAAEQLYDSLQTRILSLPDETLIGGGHYSDAAVPAADGTYTATLGDLKAEMDALSLDKPDFVELILSDMPPRPANYTEIIATNLGQQQASDDEAFELELGPNNCAASQQSLADD